MTAPQEAGKPSLAEVPADQLAASANENGPGGALTHFDPAGQAWMVDVGAKADTRRRAVALGLLRMAPATATLVASGHAAKGDVLGVARVAGIMGAKRTADLVPLCHPVALTHVSVQFRCGRDHVEVTACAETHGPTGVEMEALTAASVALLTVYDMCKAVDRGMQVESLGLLEKEGGRSGHWRRETLASDNGAAAQD